MAGLWASVPDESDLAQSLAIEDLNGICRVAAANTLIEGQSRIVVLQYPYDQTVKAMRLEHLVRCLEETATEAHALIFRTKVKLVDFAVLLEILRTIAAQGGVASDFTTNFKKKHCRRPAKRIRPPARAATSDHRIKSAMGNDPGVCSAPRTIVNGRYGFSIFGVSSANIDRKRCHSRLTIDPPIAGSKRNCFTVTLGRWQCHDGRPNPCASVFGRAATIWRPHGEGRR